MTKEEKARLKELNNKIKNYRKQNYDYPGSVICP